MTTRAIFVVSNLGKWQDDSGSSRGISNQQDLDHLRASRAWSHVIVSSGETVRANSYSPTLKPLKIFSRSDSQNFSKLVSEGNAEVIHGSVSATLVKLKGEFDNLLIEFGPKLLTQALSAHLIDEFDLSIVGQFDIANLRELIAGLPFPITYADYEVLEQGPALTLLRFYL